MNILRGSSCDASVIHLGNPPSEYFVRPQRLVIKVVEAESRCQEHDEYNQDNRRTYTQ